MPLFIDLRVGESVLIDKGRVSITLREKSGQRARLEIYADKSVRIEKIKATSNFATNGLTQMPATSAG